MAFVPRAREPSGAVPGQPVPGEEGDGCSEMLAWLGVGVVEEAVPLGSCRDGRQTLALLPAQVSPLSSCLTAITSSWHTPASQRSAREVRRTGGRGSWAEQKIGFDLLLAKRRKESKQIALASFDSTLPARRALELIRTSQIRSGQLRPSDRTFPGQLEFGNLKPVPAPCPQCPPFRPVFACPCDGD